MMPAIYGVSLRDLRGQSARFTGSVCAATFKNSNVSITGDHEMALNDHERPRTTTLLRAKIGRITLDSY
jgi:hypothetical protein